MNIRDLYKFSFNNPDRWDYYNNSPFLRFDELFPKEKSLDFIRNYLNKGEKNELDVLNNCGELSSNRLNHIVSAFFLGTEIYNRCELIRKNITFQISNINSPNKCDVSQEARFYYIWMLICLFHDCGYTYEEKKILISKTELRKTINNLLKRKAPKFFPYSSIVIRRYEEYREMKMGVVDHGIIGGAFLFKELCDLRKQKEHSSNSCLFWGEKLEEDFLIAAWAIACHNIYTTKEGSETSDVYRFYKLDKLISEKRVIEINRHPLLFLLCLVDSIEPIKLIEDNNLLNNIGIEIDDNSIVLDLCELPCTAKLKYKEKLMDINSWLTKTDADEDKVTIAF